MSTRFKHYLKNIEQNLKVGNATEHTHRPALKALLEALDLSITATNEPRRIECGAPDYVVTQNELVIGYIEAKDVGKSLVETEKSDQLKRYRQSLENLVLTDYLEFRWYVDGDRRETARLAQPANGGALKTEKGGIKAVENLLHSFLDHQSQPVKTPQNLAVRMARLAHMIRDIIIEAYEQERASDLLQGWRQAFAEVLIADLDQPDKTDDFADMVAQTLAYGLFSARVMDPTPTTFTRYEAQQLIPKSNPFLRKFFARITSIELDDEPFAPFVDDLVNLLAHTDMEAVLADFGRRTRQEDPVVHFYETFLAAYDPKLRESRGVYYTPEPVVSYIVRSVDHLLKTRFGCPQGLADSTKITVPNYDPALKTKDGKMRKTTESHKVLILDPATGTGTFLYAVIDFIRQQFMGQGNAGMWPGYVRHHLLPRLFGFELLMAPYAVAHFKLSLQLEGHDLPEAQRKQWRYSFAEDERLGVYLTNALAEAHEMTGLPLFTQWVADETNAANRVKQMLPVLVVMGNPPYSVSSSNRGDWIEGLMDTYKAAVRSDRNIQPLSDDYIKFIRFSQDRIERTGYGIVGLITNHSYLFSLVHRGMRQELMKAFDEIYVLNLHGNALLGNTTPDGQVDKNVFDIRQGVSITLLIKERKNIKERGRVFHAEIWGARGDKYKYLTDHDISKTSWRALEPRKPYFFFVPKDNDSLSEYEQGIKITNMVLHSSTGVGTGRDRAFVSFDSSEVIRFAKDLADVNLKNEQITEKYDVRDTSGWNFFLRRQSLIGSDISQDIVPYQYRPFDLRYVFYNPVMRRDQRQMMNHLRHNNLTLLVCQQQASLGFKHVFCARHIVDESVISNRTRERGYCIPLYLYPTEDGDKQKPLFETSPWPTDEDNGGRIPNLNPEFVNDLEQRLGLTFEPILAGGDTTFTPEDVFDYIYAVFFSPTYRERYAEFLKIDFPRVPLTSDVELFCKLAGLGCELVDLHLLESPQVGQFITSYPTPGDNRVEKGYPKYKSPIGDGPGRVYINKTQYFEGIPPEVWEFYVGGYQVCDKWLKDRRSRQLSYDELTHYQQMIVALKETIRLMSEINEIIDEHGGWPIK